MARAKLYVGEAWPALFVDGPVSPYDSDRIAYDVDDEALENYKKARAKFLKAERELLESIDHTNPDQLMESEMRMYLSNLPKD